MGNTIYGNQRKCAMATRVLSGVQPTGNLHLGNYLGAIKNWVAMQQDYDELLFCIVDLHAITVPQDPEHLRNATRQTAAAYIACGINPEMSLIFHQSAISGHSELAWLLSCLTPLGWLNRMTQFKEKAGKHKDKSCLGLYSYPVLMAADILLYHATHVPVGEDQKQHLELTRDIAGAFNRQYDCDYFTLPEPMIMGQATRVMSLRDGTQKMSKSAQSDQSRINLTDSAEEITHKIKKAKSDMIEGISYDEDARPEASNLLNIFAAVTDQSRAALEEKYKHAGFAEFKSDLAHVVAEKMAPINDKMNQLLQNPAYLDDVLHQSAQKARTLADENIAHIKEIMGFLGR